jgi:hypothetical protein
MTAPTSTRTRTASATRMRLERASGRLRCSLTGRPAAQAASLLEDVPADVVEVGGSPAGMAREGAWRGRGRGCERGRRRARLDEARRSRARAVSSWASRVELARSRGRVSVSRSRQKPASGTSVSPETSASTRWLPPTDQFHSR